MSPIENTAKPNRLFFLDNLRTFMIFLVVLVHSGGVYESSGLWGFFWIVDDPATNDLSGIIFLVVDVFIMSTIFFISGYFSPGSIKSKNNMDFIISKFKRLIVPWLLAVFTLIPLYKVIFLYSRGLPQESWTTYFHFSNGIYGQNWLWFLPVLFLFDILYLLIIRSNLFPKTMSLKTAVWSVLIIGFIYSFGMSVLELRGWTKTILIDFQNERLLIYFMYFMLGSLCSDRKIFESKPESNKFYNIINSILWIPITAYLVFLIFSIISQGNFIISQIGDQIVIWISFHLSLLGLLYVMINTFRKYFNKQREIGKQLHYNSYNVYIIHTVVLGGIALLMLNLTIPSLLKYVILTISTYIISNLIVYLYLHTKKLKA